MVRVLLDCGGADIESAEVDEAVDVLVINGRAWRLAGHVPVPLIPNPADSHESLPRYVPVHRRSPLTPLPNEERRP